MARGILVAGIEKEKKVVAEKLYPDSIIECCLLLGKVFDQPLRQTQGFGNSLLKLMDHKDKCLIILPFAVGRAVFP